VYVAVWYSVLRRVAVCCSAVRCAAGLLVKESVLSYITTVTLCNTCGCMLQSVAGCNCSYVLQGVAGVLHGVVVCCSALQCIAVLCSVLQCFLGLLVEKEMFSVLVCYSALRCVAVCCSVVQCVAVCCSVLQCVEMCCSAL